MYHLNKYITNKELQRHLPVEYSKVNIQNIRRKITNIEANLKETPLYKNIKLFNYAMTLVVKYIKTHLLDIGEIEIQKIIEKILEYLYFSNIE